MSIKCKNIFKTINYDLTVEYLMMVPMANLHFEILLIIKISQAEPVH